jgi:CheY-like chemotaxis protein
MDTNKLQFLLADDDPDDWEIFQEGLLQTAPFHNLHWVKHGDIVLEEVKNIRPDVLFLDLNMPGADGIECLKMIRQEPELQKIPVVIYTTSNAASQVRECYALGAARYLLKPVNYRGIFDGLELILTDYNRGLLLQPGFESFLIDTYKLARR